MEDEVFSEYFKNKNDIVQVLSIAYVDECLTSADVPQKERYEVSCVITSISKQFQCNYKILKSLLNYLPSHLLKF